MEAKVKVSGLNCVSCSKKIEKALFSISGVTHVVVSMPTQEVIATYVDDIPKLKERMGKIIRSIEPDVKIVESATLFKEKFPLFYLLTVVLFFIVVLLVPKNIQITLSIIGYVIIGRRVFYKAFLGLKNRDYFNENSLMILATVGAFYLKDFPEALGVMLFYSLGEKLQGFTFNRSQNAISELIGSEEKRVKLIRGEKIEEVEVETVEIGAHISIHKGDKLILDGIALTRAAFDMSPITGESLPVIYEVGDKIISGGLNIGESAEIEVTHRFEDSTCSKIQTALKIATQGKAKTENYMTKLSKVYTPLVVVMVILVLLVPTLLFHQPFSVWIGRAMILLIVSCPCALLLSIPLSFCASLGFASKCGIVIKSGEYVESFRKMEHFLFDKTGTLTTGKFQVESIDVAKGYEIQEMYTLILSLESLSGHPIAKTLVKTMKAHDALTKKVENFQEISGKGLFGTIEGKCWYIGTERFYKEEMKSECESRGILLFSSEGVACTITLSDEVKREAKEVVEHLQREGKEIVMLTGDSFENGEKTSQKLGIKTFLSGLLPTEKNSKVKEYQKKSKVLFVGEGINDALAIKSADIGIAMGKLGSGLAIESADIVIANDDLKSIEVLSKISNETMKIVWQNISVALGIKIIIIVLGVLGYSNIWEAIFADVGVAIITVLNATRLLYMRRNA
ncbi:MAG: heavy metal translocating P-type ATPase [Fusobacteria bacterium]|nr:heavy metal translocating P-type ATPase [Fusobacteriota bacterium]